MATQTKKVSPPKGISRLFFRFPILLFKIGLGWIFGKRFLLLHHTGRKSGLPRKVVLEVPKYDKETNTYYVNAGFGPKSDWFRNIQKQPQNSIQVGNKTHKVIAKQVSAEESGQIMLEFAKKYPFEAKFIAKGVGYYDVGDADEDWINLGREMIFVALRPVD
ncbi:MAG: nitroreductase family deazaflavin-dependent oxidoreductase [Anaerolineaceae bacterium]|nr:nitroreductase family deazaflavin-dependent oxidoreductase [Anaerolineaceae bacterium]